MPCGCPGAAGGIDCFCEGGAWPRPSSGAVPAAGGFSGGGCVGVCARAIDDAPSTTSTIARTPQRPIDGSVSEMRAIRKRASSQDFFTTSTMPCTLWALFASMPFSSLVSGIWTIFSMPLPPTTTGTPMKRSL